MQTQVTRFGEECLGEFVIMLNTNCALMELKWRVNSNQARLAPSTRDSASYSERRCTPLVSLGASLEFTLRECNRRHIADPLFPKARRFLSREERHAPTLRTSTRDRWWRGGGEFPLSSFLWGPNRRRATAGPIKCAFVCVRPRSGRGPPSFSGTSPFSFNNAREDELSAEGRVRKANTKRQSIRGHVSHARATWHPTAWTAGPWR